MNRSMSCFVQRNGTFLCCCHNLGFPFPDHRLYGRLQPESHLFPLTVLSGGQLSEQLHYKHWQYQLHESRSLASQQVNVYRIIQFQWAEMYAKYFFTFVQVGADLHKICRSNTSGTKQGLIQNIYTVGCSQDNNSTV